MRSLQTPAGPFRTYLHRFGNRRTFGDDAKAGLVLGIESVPDGLAAGTLAGINPLFGLNAYLVGTVTGALSTGSLLMTVQATGDPSADFRGQGLANLSSGLLSGMPVGGSMSATALVRAAGAKTALTGLVAGTTMIVTILLCGPLIEDVAMPALAGLLVIVGIRSLKPQQFAMVWRTGSTQSAVFATAFLLTLTIPLQYAVMAGVALSVVVHVIQQSTRVRVVRWTFEAPDSRPLETDPPAVLAGGEPVVLTPYGTLFFASAQAFRAQLPTPNDRSAGATVIIRLRGTEELGVTFLTMLQDYCAELSACKATLMLTGVDDDLGRQLKATGLQRVIGAANVFAAKSRLGDSASEAFRAVAERRRAAGDDHH